MEGMLIGWKISGNDERRGEEICCVAKLHFESLDWDGREGKGS